MLECIVDSGSRCRRKYHKKHIRHLKHHIENLSMPEHYEKQTYAKEIEREYHYLVWVVDIILFCIAFVLFFIFLFYVNILGALATSVVICIILFIYGRHCLGCYGQHRLTKKPHDPRGHAYDFYARSAFGFRSLQKEKVKQE